jgi:tRNA A37 threonylcarbamoyladenosine dehydratase
LKNNIMGSRERMNGENALEKFQNDSIIPVSVIGTGGTGN